MKNLYSKNTANYPRLSSDKLFVDYGNAYKYEGKIDEAVDFIMKNQLLRTDLWKRFSEQFATHTDKGEGWRGEFWGKMMRGACFVYSYTKDEALYNLLKNSVADMMKTADENGRISSYPVDVEFRAWDMWCRKYVLLGMQYFSEICDDEEFKTEIVKSMKGQVDYLISKIGREEGKTPITETTNFWRGLNSSSILEPVVRLYAMTGEKRFLEFAEYIISEGGTCIANIFELAYEDEIYPYQYPMTKAYEMISCFEGVLEYYRVTGNEKYKSAVINFANKLLESDFTVIGSGGCTHELFDHSSVRQTNPNNGPTAQETCVTVTYMKFFYQLLLLTGDPKFADAFERSLYNAYLGALNTELVKEDAWICENHPDWYIEALPFDSYSPLTKGRRGVSIGGLMYMPDNHYYGCCACIGSAGIGLVPKVQLMTTEKGSAINLYVNGTADTTTPSGNKLTLVTKTAYPASGKVEMTVKLEKSEEFELSLRIPEWSKKTAISINGENVPVTTGYTVLNKEWKNGDTIILDLDMRTEVIRPIPYEPQFIMTNVFWGYHYVTAKYDKQDPEALNNYAFRRGPIVLAQDKRLGNEIDGAVEINTDVDYIDTTEADKSEVPYDCTVAVKLPLMNGGEMLLTDYASAGKLYSGKSALAAWIKTKK